MSNNFKLSRRRFLAGVGSGLSLAAASSLTSPLAFASSASGRPQRFVIYYVPHGWPIEQVDIFGEGGSWLDDSPMLSAFSPWQDLVTVVRGISQTEGGGHGSCHKILTGKGFGKDSIDTTIAEAMETQPWVTSVCSNTNYFHHINFQNGSGTKPYISPLDFVDAAFGENFNNPVVLDQESRFRTELLLMSERELESLSNKLAAISTEKNRVTRHIESVREVKAMVARRVPGGIESSSIDDLKTRLSGLEGLDFEHVDNTTAILDGQIDAMATAVISGAVNVGTIRIHSTGGQWTANFPDGPGVEKNTNPHGNSHAGNKQRRIDEYGKNLRWYLDRLATFIDRLNVADPLDPTHTVLENTTILYTSDMCDGSHVAEAKDINVAGGTHYTYFPAVLIGGGAGKINTGGVVEAENTHFDLLQTLAHIHNAERNDGKIITDLLA